MMSTKPFGQSSIADQAAQGADSAIGRTQQMADEALSSLSDKVHDMRGQAAPVINRVAAKAEELARRSADAMRDRSQLIKEQAYRAQDMTVGYIKDEPLKSILMAAAAGAALMALLQLLRTRDH
ncbi:MAG TPA: hypothetical protein VFB53_09515 [Burkholderiales bacterium]|nr:hypothetical protein [Burkholderiales bacterium]